MTQNNPPEKSTSRLSVLALTSQYPNAASPHQASFNRQQFAELAKICDLSVVAPVPIKEMLGPGQNPSKPLSRHPPVVHPVFWYPPKFKRQWHGRTYLWSVWPAVQRVAKSRAFDVMLATWLYPDGWAAGVMARRLGLPLVIKLHGSDVHTLGRDATRRPKLIEALAAANKVVAVSRDLAEAAEELGAAAERITVVPNGIDHDLFRPRDKLRAREELGLDPHATYLLFLGRLNLVKGPDLAVEALTLINDANLLVVGDGPMEESLKQRAARLGLGERVLFLGQRPHQEVPRYLAACDLLVLPSRSEGQPNAVLEALAAERPVVAAAVGGVPEIVADSRQGMLFPPEDPAALAAAVRRALEYPWDNRVLAEPLAQRSWKANAAKLLEVLGTAGREAQAP